MAKVKHATSVIDLYNKVQQELRKAKQALELADSIMAYCGGDKWERECTADDRAKYVKLYEEIMGKGSGA